MLMIVFLVIVCALVLLTVFKYNNCDGETKIADVYSQPGLIIMNYFKCDLNKKIAHPR